MTLHHQVQPPVGVALAVHNRVERARECLQALSLSNYSSLLVCVVDDGSTDGTWEMLTNEFPHVHSLRGDGNLWWAGATNKAIRYCLHQGCQHILLLNPDCIIASETIGMLLRYANRMPDTVLAPVVVPEDNPAGVWWAGTIWGPLHYFPVVWLLRSQRWRSGDSVHQLPSAPFDTAETGGRAVLVPSKIFRRVGLLDDERFPHHAADNDFGLRVREAGFRIVVVPEVRVRLYSGETGLALAKSLKAIPAGYLRRLFSRKHGESLRCAWYLSRKHAPWYAVVPSFMFSLLLVTWRYWSLSTLGVVRQMRTSKSSSKHSLQYP